MNIIQQQNYLEYADKNDLVKMMQEPVPQFPSFLVLQEIQRRTINEQNFKAMEERPTTTVAEEVVNEFAQPQLAQNQSQGLQGGTPQSATPLPDSNISAGLSGVPTAPMQMAAIGGLTGYANTGITSLPAGSAPYPANMPVEKLARMLGVDIYAANGSLKDSAVLDAEMRERFAAYNQPAVGNTSGLPSGTAPAPAPIPASAPSIDLVDIQNQLSKTVPSALGIDQDKIAGLSQVNTNTTSALPTSGTAQTTADKFSEAMENKVFATPRIDIKDLGNITPNRELLPEIPKIKRDYYEVSDEDRQKELDVFALAGLAQAVGGSKNLAELGIGVADTATGISGLKKDQRTDQRAVSDAKYRDELATYGLEFDRTRIINEALTADNAAEMTAKLKIAEKNLDLDAQDADRAITAIRNDTTLAGIDATNNAQLKPFVTGFMTELNSLKEKTLPSDLDIARIKELENLINQLLINATQKAGVDMEEILSKVTPDLKFDPNAKIITTP
tara:strand:- start:1061 stop:2566 length:1506 start_codon:yes stop_codon:yes gene_type:complete